jgi:hypothetical protein
MDLRHAVPRSPFAVLDGYAWLPRAIDKARAKQAGTLGEYWFPGPFDDDFLAFLGVSVTAFELAVAEAADDDAVLAWVSRTTGKTQSERETWRQRLWAAGPDPANGGQVFAKRLAEVAPGRTDIRTWCHLLAAEEGHPLPEGLNGL